MKEYKKPIGTIKKWLVSPDSGVAVRRRGQGLALSAKEAYFRYNQWCISNKLVPINKGQFRPQMKRNGYSCTKNHGLFGFKTLRAGQGAVPTPVPRVKRNIGHTPVIYIWELLGEKFLGKKVYKLGITSRHRGISRIEEVARGFDVEYSIVCYRIVKNAWEIEQVLLEVFPDKLNHYDGDGSSELRALEKEDLEWCLRYVEAVCEC